MSRTTRLLSLLAFAVLAACTDPNQLAKATLENRVDTLTLYSLATAPLNQPSAYSLTAGTAVRTWDVGTNFDFAYSTNSAGKSVFLTLDLLGLASSSSVKPGLIRATSSFDQMTKAPLDGYVTSDTILVAEQDLFFLRTGITTCHALGVPLYGKLEVLDIDSVAQSVKFRVLSDQNCGYRGLGLGIPKS
jgi:hypothetical protein